MKRNICSLLFFVSLFAVRSFAQPTLTTEDVVKWRAANPERAQHYIPKTQDALSSKQSQDQLDAAFLAAEKDWNARLAEARRRVQDFDRRANQTEIQAAQSRNVVFHNDAAALNANNARVAQLQELARTYRNETRLAQEAVNRLLDEGRQYGFQLTYISPRLKNGEPNLDYYRSRFLELQTELQDERKRAEVLQLRTNRVQTIINANLNSSFYNPTTRRGFIFYPNNGAADAFYLNRLRDELGGVGGDLNATQARIAILNAQLEELREEGRRAGVPPGIFR
jgi:hypothetical protein